MFILGKNLSEIKSLHRPFEYNSVLQFNYELDIYNKIPFRDVLVWKVLLLLFLTRESCNVCVCVCVCVFGYFLAKFVR